MVMLARCQARDDITGTSLAHLGHILGLGRKARCGTTIGVFSLWTHTMNRCIHQPVFLQLASHLLLALLVIGVGVLVSFPTASQAQSPVRPFPASAKRAVLEVQVWPAVLLNGEPERLSPGSRIRGVNNMLMMSGQLVGQRLVVNYTRDGQGMVHEVWLLNPYEAQLERPGSEPTRNWRFESDPVKSK